MRHVDFDLYDDEDGNSWVPNFLNTLSEYEHDKVITRLQKYRDEYSYAELMNVRNLIKLSGYDNLYEVRIPLKNKSCRLLGPMIGGVVVFVHAFVKKSNKTPAKEIKITEKRSKQIKHEIR